MPQTEQLDLLDKICNLKLIEDSGDYIEIKTPDEGYKPQIRISGHMIPSIMSGVDIRITNFYPPKDLTDYKQIEITVGYKNTKLQETISGQIWSAYRDTPGPDGVTYFHLNLGYFDKFLNQKYQKSFADQTPLLTIFQALATELGMGLSYKEGWLASDVVIDKPMYFNGTIKDAVMKMVEYCKQIYRGFCAQMDSKDLVLYSMENGVTDKVWNIDYFSSVPRRDAAGWTFVSPWIPGMRPGHYCNISSTFAKQSYNETIAFSQTTMKALVQDIQFDFGTNDSINQMTCMVLDSGQAAGTSNG